MDSFINIVKAPLRGPPPEEGGRAAARVDSNTDMSVIPGCLDRMNTGVGVCLQRDESIDTPLHQKRARTDRTEDFFAATSTLEYDKWIADS